MFVRAGLCYLRGESFWVNWISFLSTRLSRAPSFHLVSEDPRDFYILVAPCLVQPSPRSSVPRQPSQPRETSRARRAGVSGGCGLSPVRLCCKCLWVGAPARVTVGTQVPGAASAGRCAPAVAGSAARPAQSAHRGSCRGSNSQVTVSPCDSRVCWSSSASPAQLSLRAAVSPGPARHNDRVTARRSRPSGAQLWVVLLPE